MKKRINLIFLIVCIILTIPALVGIFHPGFFLSDDGNWMVIRFSAFYEALRNGQFPVRFLPRLNNGYGYPVADFLYPLFMYLAVPIHILKFNFVDTIKIILGLSIILSSVFTFFWLRKLFDNLSSLVGAVFYTFFPYHLYDVYKRGSVGEVLSLSVLPFVLWQLERKSLIWVSLGIAFLILAHNTLAVMFLPLVFCYMLLEIYESTERRKLVEFDIKSFVLGFGISSFFWLPALFDLQYTVFFKIQVSTWESYFSASNLSGLSVLFVMLSV
ncbi:6-pyruvoyl-tetrahydropterin synthase-related protein, partial [Patescibacteria group bacterium]|nr:6-pyruvoyl-tetrahydropterin synthase-related protein [Patescibacteria group bacterium]